MELNKAYSGMSLTGGGPISPFQQSPQTQQHSLLFQKIMPMISSVFCPDELPDYTCSAWTLLIGVEDHFLLHIAPYLTTSVAYNSVDPDADHPMLVYGYQQKLWSQALLETIKKRFPPEHATLPAQVAITFTPLAQDVETTPTQQELCDLITGTTPALFMGNYKLEVMDPPRGKQSLSFKKVNFPIEFWTHDRRDPPLKTALETLKKELEQTNNLILEAKIQPLQIVYDQEIKIKGLADQMKKADEAIKRMERRQSCLETKKSAVMANPQALASINNAIRQAEKEAQQSRSTLDKLDDQLKQARDKLKDLQDRYHLSLPRSYLEATFQFTADFTDNQGRRIYKRFSEGGEILTEIDQNENAFLNKVHLPYTQ